MNNDKPPPPTDDQDEELRLKAGEWLLAMRETGRASRDSDPERIVAYLQREGNEKLELGIELDKECIEERLRTLDAEIAEQSKLRREDPSPSSSSGTDAPVVEELGQNPPVSFIRRTLQKSDVREQQHRLSMPRSQVHEEVLTAAEMEAMVEGKHVAAEVIDTGGRRYDVELKLVKAGGTTSYSYAIGKPWNEIRKESKLRAGMVLNVWGSRGENGKLCFRLEREEG